MNSEEEKRLKDIKERAKVWIKSKDTAAMILDHHGVSGAAMAIYTQAASDQDRIARAEEKERCIKAAQNFWCSACVEKGQFKCKYKDSCYTLSLVRKAIEEGGEG